MEVVDGIEDGADDGGVVLGIVEVSNSRLVSEGLEPVSPSFLSKENFLFVSINFQSYKM